MASLHEPEVYETSDVELEPAEVPSQVLKQDNKDIETAALSDPSTVSGTFERFVLTDEVTIPDFSGSLAASVSGYSVRKSLESRPEKLARIAQELQDLTKELNGDEVEQLEQMLASLETSKSSRLEILTQLAKKYGQGREEPSQEHVTSPEQPRLPSYTPDPRVLEIEKKILQLETLVGSFTLERLLHAHVAELKRRLDILGDPQTELGPIRQEIQSTTSALDKLNSSRRMAHLNTSIGHSLDAAESPFERKIASLYSRLPDMENAMTVVPSILSRLRSLHEVHVALANLATLVSGLDSVMAEVNQDMVLWTTSLDKVSTALDDHEQVFEKNKELVEKRLLQLEAKYEKESI